MPFVQRNWKGEIVGLYASPQPQPDGTSLTNSAQLPDDHPDVVAFREKQPPLPPDFMKPLTADEAAQMHAESKRIEKEHAAIHDAVIVFNKNFAELETALGALLNEILHIPKSQLAYAIYYSPDGFHARTVIVENCIIQLASENKELEKLTGLWEKISKKLGRVRTLRNALAHGSQLTLVVREKKHVRFAPLAFDVVRLGRTLAEGQIPGYMASTISEGTKNLVWLTTAIDCVNRLVFEFHDGNPSLLERYRLLEAHLDSSVNPQGS